MVSEMYEYKTDYYQSQIPEEANHTASRWFQSLRDNICDGFEKIEKEMGGDAVFQRKQWERSGGGSGEMSIMRGEIFEKVGVNISTVQGMLPEALKQQFEDIGCSGEEFWASGVSLVAHMKSPLVPSVHMNTRMLVTRCKDGTKKWWFGGGADLTPTIEFDEDTADFHAALKEACDKHDSSYYNQFKAECDEYFFIKHRKVARGVGGIFYDYLNSGNWSNDFEFNKEVGLVFLKIFTTLVRRRYRSEWDEKQKMKQLEKRALYAEFNLLYDRGTKFGFLTGGNPEAILMSLPPLCAWY